MPALLAEAEQHLAPRMYRLLCVVAEEWRQMEDQIEQLDARSKPLPRVIRRVSVCLPSRGWDL
jgi:hypothetical protein